jgi:predicted Fe-S protein YdhL (DUF1289 family)
VAKSLGFFVKTPCIGICSTIYGDEKCRGCKRHYQEVIDWNGYSKKQKHRVNFRLQENIINLCQAYFEIIDFVLLQKKVVHHAIDTSNYNQPYSLAFALLQNGYDKIHNLENFGLRALPNYQHLSVKQLFERLDEDLFHI